MPFQCILDKCPKDSEQCHLWWEIPWENKDSGEISFKKGCIMSQQMGLPIIQDIVRSAHISSEHTSKLNNTMYDGFRSLAQIAIEHSQTQRPLEVIGNFPGIEQL